MTAACHPLQVLAAHEGQAHIKKRFQQFKSVHKIAPVFLKNEARIEALFTLHFLTLLVQAIIERQLRLAMQRQGIDELPRTRRAAPAVDPRPNKSCGCLASPSAIFCSPLAPPCRSSSPTSAPYRSRYANASLSPSRNTTQTTKPPANCPNLRENASANMRNAGLASAISSGRREPVGGHWPQGRHRAGVANVGAAASPVVRCAQFPGPK